jgi:hypothetical protein
VRQIIEVTQADIDAANALRKEYLQKYGWATSGICSSRCPVAMAVRRLYPDATEVHVDGSRVRRGTYLGYGYAAANTSATMRRFMCRWDRTWKASPTRFLVIWD